MSSSPNTTQVVGQWLLNFKRHTSTNLRDDPNYYLSRPETLVTTSQPQKLLIGTGKQIFRDILPVFLSAKYEIILVTCFWAKSPSQAALADALRVLSSRCASEGRRIRVRICFSSVSLWQKLTQTSSLSGKEHAPSSWESLLGLPKPSELGGLDIRIRSIFIWPFSIMHPKFVIIDREVLFLPSCNVSWENWLEGCIQLRGGIVEQALLFWMNFWARGERDVLKPLSVDQLGSEHRNTASSSSVSHSLAIYPQGDLFEAPLDSMGAVPTILLPSPHHRNPSFRLMPWSSPAPPPPTPLNTFLTTAIDTATRSIYIQSPNVNSPPILSAIAGALVQGVDVRIISNVNMMIIEQLATAGTRTESALRKLYSKWMRGETRSRHLQDVEAAMPRPGKLEIFYYEAVPPDKAKSGAVEPAKSHLKLTIVDEEIVVLGSGNMDRASWYTSQELGVAFISRQLAKVVMDGVNKNLEGRLRNAFPAK
jgi:phosphatidylserine/phosphatidylglycerophosphate/cardiolipin synthase-like enzyme